MSENEDTMSEVDIPTAVDPYRVLDIEPTATEDEVKKAYRKAALKNHPDKVSAEQKEEAHTAFQRIAFAYAILSNPARRSLYDETGSTEETVSVDPDWSWTEFYRAQYADVITSDAITAFAAKYRHSDEERKDLLSVYTKAKGNMDVVYSEVMLSHVVEDDERFRAIIDEAIGKGEVELHLSYKGETTAKRDKRKRKAQKEATEAEQMAKHLGVHDKLFAGGDATAGPDDDDVAATKVKKSKGGNKKTAKKDKDPEAGLAALIRSRQADRSNNQSFLDRLVDKYGAKEPSRKRGKENKTEEPDEEAFQATRRQLEKKRKKRKVEVEDEDEVPIPKKRPSRRTKAS